MTDPLRCWDVDGDGLIAGDYVYDFEEDVTYDGLEGQAGEF